MNCPYDQNDDDLPPLDPHQWDALYADAAMAFEPTSRLERWLALKAFGAFLLLLLAAAVVIGAYLIAARLVEPRPYTDPSPPPAVEENP